MFGSNAAQAPVRPLAWSAAPVGTPASTAETVLKTYTIAADTFNVDGKRLRAVFTGDCAANANTKTIRLRLGPVTLTGTIIAVPIASAYSGLGWNLEVDIVRRAVDSQTSEWTFLSDGGAIATALQIGEVAAANDDAGAMLLELTGQNGVATANDIRALAHFIEILDQP